MFNDAGNLPPQLYESANEEVLADIRFSSLFAPKPLRPAIINLWHLHLRLLTVEANPEEPHIALIRLAWWRDTLAQLDAHQVRGEPLLKALLESVPHRVFPAAATLAEAHMDRVEDGNTQGITATLKSVGASLLGEGREKPFLAPLAAVAVHDRSPTRRHLAILRYMLGGRLPSDDVNGDT